MKKIALSLFFSLPAVLLTAQVQLCPSDGPALARYNCCVHDMQLISSSDTEFTAYCGPVVSGKKHNRHSIVTYDKSANTLSVQELVLPEKTYRLAAADIGDSLFVAYSHYLNRRQYEYATAVVPKGQPVVNVGLARKLAFETKNFGGVKEFAARSHNGKFNAVLLMNHSMTGDVKDIHFFVYDEKGREAVSKSFSFAVEGDHFDVADFKVSDDGTAVFLFRTGRQKMQLLQAGKLQILTYKDNDFTANYSIDFPGGVVNSAKMCLLRNGDIFIGGYTAPSAFKRENGCFATVFRPSEAEFGPIYSYPLSDEVQSGVPGTLPFHLLCTDLLELENGNVTMLGEFTAMVLVTSNSQGMMSRTYHHYTYHIVYATFGPDGACPSGEVSRMLCRRAGRAASFGCSSTNEEVSLKYTALGLSHSAFAKGNDVYVLFTDNRKNLMEHDSRGPAADLALFRGKTCLTMARLATEGEPEYSLVYLAGKAKKTMNKLWYFDGENVYFGSNNLKSYWIDHFRLGDE